MLCDGCSESETEVDEAAAAADKLALCERVIGRADVYEVVLH